MNKIEEYYLFKEQPKVRKIINKLSKDISLLDNPKEVIDSMKIVGGYWLNAYNRGGGDSPKC